MLWTGAYAQWSIIIIKGPQLTWNTYMQQKANGIIPVRIWISIFL